MSRNRRTVQLRVEKLERRALPASLFLAVKLDVASGGDAAESSACFQLLSAVACEHISLWEQQHHSDQILQVFHRSAMSSFDPSDEEEAISPVRKTPQYCEAIDQLIEEMAASEIVRCIHEGRLIGELESDYRDAVDQFARQFRDRLLQDSDAGNDRE